MTSRKPDRTRASSGVALVLAVCGLVATSCSAEPTRASPARESAASPAETDQTSQPTGPPPTTVAVDPAVEAFVVDCGSHVGFKLQTGDGPYTAVWGHLDATGIETECRRIPTADPATFASIQAEIAQLREFFAAAEAAETTTTAPPPPPPPPPPPMPSGRPPSVRLNCGAPVTGTWDWYRIDYSYDVDYYDPIVEWGMDYGDGKSFAAHDEVKALQDVYWHKYNSPGSYTARAWVVDSFGRRAEATCTFSWFGGSNDGGGGSPAYNDDDDYYSGDLDCEDIGEEVYVGGGDPNNLDGDGDGVGCEGQ